MKKFMAIVMCLAMALSMMTVVSFAADAQPYVGAKGEINVAAGATKDIPVYIGMTDGSEVTFGLIELYANVPDEIEYELVAGSLSLENVYTDPENAKRISVLDGDGGKTFKNDVAAFTIRITAPATAGKYTIAFEEWMDTCFITDNSAFEPYEKATVEDIVINVEAPVAEPTVAATKVDADPENGAPVALYILQPKNAKAYGIKYVGTNEEYKDAKFASLAPATDAMAAVKVVGLDNAFEAYAE